MSAATLDRASTQVDVRQKHWQGAIASTVLQALLFWPLYVYTNPFIASLVILAINIPLAALYNNANPYITGARWATFLNLAWMSFARHDYWYSQFNTSFDKLKDYDRPVGYFQILATNNIESIINLLITSVLIIVFYSFTPRWHEWDGQWERARWSLLSGSLGMQAIIIAVSIKPSVTSITCAVLFASVISPILRRQVRFNHILFTLLVPMLALNNGIVSIITCIVSGLLFLFYVAIERSLTPRIASFSFALGILFLAAFVTQLQDWATYLFGRSTIGIVALIIFILTVGPALLIVKYRNNVMDKIRAVYLALIPKRLYNANWWKIRESWVDREVYCRVNGLYKNQKLERTLGTIIFGQRVWAKDSEGYSKVKYPRINITPAVLVIPFYAVWLAIEWALNLTNVKSALMTNSLLILGFGLVLLIPIYMLKAQKEDNVFYSRLSVMASIATITIFTCTSFLYLGYSVYTLMA